MKRFEATKLIKGFRPNLSIVAQTAYTTYEDKEKHYQQVVMILFQNL